MVPVFADKILIALIWWCVCCGWVSLKPYLTLKNHAPKHARLCNALMQCNYTAPASYLSHAASKTLVLMDSYAILTDGALEGSTWWREMSYISVYKVQKFT